VLSTPQERRKYLALLWSNSCCSMFTAALVALGAGRANPPAATAQVVLVERCSEWVNRIKTGQDADSYGSTCGALLV